MRRRKIDAAVLSGMGHETETLAAGRTVFTQGETGSCMYILRSGSVRLEVDGEAFETLGPDEFLGEMALIDGSARRATAVTLEDSELVVIDERTFIFLVQEHPYFALDVMAVMAERLRRMNQRV